MDRSPTTLYDLITPIKTNDTTEIKAHNSLIDEIKALEEQLTAKKDTLVKSAYVKQNKLAFARYFLYGVGLEDLLTKLVDFDFLKIENEDEYEISFTFTFDDARIPGYTNDLNDLNNVVYLRFSFFLYGNKIILSHDGETYYSISDVNIDKAGIIRYKSLFIPNKYPKLLDYEKIIIYNLNTDLLEEQYDRTFYTDDMITTLREFMQGTFTEHSHFFNELDEEATKARFEAEQAKYREERDKNLREKIMKKKQELNYDEVVPKKKGLDYLNLEKALIDASISFESEEELADNEDLGIFTIFINKEEYFEYSALLRNKDPKQEIIILSNHNTNKISSHDKKILEIIIKNNNDEDYIISLDNVPSVVEKYLSQKFLIGAYEDDFANDKPYITQHGQYQLNSCGVPLDWVISKKSFPKDRTSILWSVPFQYKKYAFVYNAYETNKFKLSDIKYEGKKFPQLDDFVADESGNYYILQTDEIPVGWIYAKNRKDPQEGMWNELEADDLGGSLDLIIF